MYSDLAGKKLLIMGGMQISCEIIKKAQRMGIIVGVADYNRMEDSPGKQIADKAHLVSTLDVDAMADLITREKYDGVLTGFVDLLLPYYAEICEKTGLPAYGTKEQFELFVNKDKYKALCRKHNIPTVEEYVVDLAHFEQTTAGIEYPVLVKPVDSSGARGITICHSRDELRDALEKAKAFSRTGQFMVERYLTGKEVTVFWLFKNGKRYLTCIGNRHVKANQEGVIPLPVGYTFPAAITASYQKETEPCVQEMFEEVGIQNGMMFMQCKVENGTCVVYDIGFRLTASLEYDLLKQVCGFDPMEMLIRFALTGSMGEPELETKIRPIFDQYAFNVSLLGKPGIIREITGCEDVLHQEGILDLVVAHHAGEEITEEMRGLLAQVVLRVLGTADSMDDLKVKMHTVTNSIAIISDQGMNLLLPGVEDGDFEGVLE